MRTFSPVAITRAGVALPKSPFQCRVFMGSYSGQRHEVEPDITKSQSAKVLTFQDVTAAVALADMATLLDGTLSKIINIQRFTRTLQCNLQIIPFQSFTLWTQDGPATRVVSGDTKGAHYTSAGPVLAYIEPMADMAAALGAMNITTRTARCFSITSLPARSVIHDGADYWITKTASEHWAVTNDFVAYLEHLPKPPFGVL